MLVEKSLKPNIHDPNTDENSSICQIINEKRADILLKFYEQMHSHVRASEVFEARISFGVIAIYLLTTVFLFRGDVTVQPSIMATVLLSIFNLALFLFAWALLNHNNVRLSWQCKKIGEAETRMGLYTCGAFGEGAILDSDDADWGATHARKFTHYHLSGMAISALVPIATLHARPFM